MDVDVENGKILARFVPGSIPLPLDWKFDDLIMKSATDIELSGTVNNGIRAKYNAGWSDKRFVFFIHGKRFGKPSMSIEEFIRLKRIYIEDALEIDYFIPGNEGKPLEHGRSINAVDGSYSGFIFTGCGDRLGRVWNDAGVCTHMLEGHSHPILSVSVVHPQDNLILATASNDGTLGLWKLPSPKMGSEGHENSPAKISPFKIFQGHAKPIWSTAAQTSGSKICSGSSDKTVKLWETDESTSEGSSVSLKKRRTECAAEESQLEGKLLATLTGHKELVSSVAWPEPNVICSASWDHSIKRWDVNCGTSVLTNLGSSSLRCLSVAGPGGLVAAGAYDGKIRIFCPKKPGASYPVKKLSSQNDDIMACQFLGDNTYWLLSAYREGTVMLWDLRKPERAKYVVESGERLLCADWWNGGSVLTGGDLNLRISSIPRHVLL